MDGNASQIRYWVTLAVGLVALPLLVLVGVGIGRGGEREAATIAAPQSVPPPAATAVTLPGDNRDPVAPQPESEVLPAGERAAGTASTPIAGKPAITIAEGRSAEMRDSPGGDVVATVADTTQFGSPTVFSVRRVRGNWLGVPTSLRPNGELGWIRADPAVMTASHTDFRVVVDLSNHRARLLRGEELLRSWTVTVGAPGSETPTGRFSVTDLFKGGLNPAYGCCAVALSATQPNLPSGWAGGDLIAIHGTDEPLGIDASHGCVRSADGDVRALVRRIPLGTPVTIRS